MTKKKTMSYPSKSRRAFLQSAAAVTGASILGLDHWPAQLLAATRHDPHLTKSVPWAGQGQHRLLVRVDPLDIAQRPWEQTPAEIVLDFSQLQGLGPTDRADICSI